MDIKIKKYVKVMFTVAVIFPMLALGKKGKDANLEIITLSKPEECTAQAEVGDEVAVHYTGTLESGQVFDSSVQANRDPLPFVLGEGKVIPGWERGILGMCVGEKRKLVIPSQLAYGDRGFPPAIPPKATLIFETELMDLRKNTVSAEQNIMEILRFLSLPVGIVLIIYYIYQKYQADVAKETTKEKRGKKKRQ